ncbi:hypothetical protein LTR36_001798 [Oleoguttula mirabilis]|uniref:NmrA-like domain-containing protein n=1 Tax=Oleoguttula mirabilis TaxID=1507867 RepID=A0AAV9JMN1_9PEZI|nr:hypothetical protein LTR36_001798 [Oleoguttula mirabilis]
MSTYLKNVALVGASGNLGSKVLSALLRQDKHAITVITRPNSSAKFPASVKVHKAEYRDAGSLESAFKGQDIVVLMLAFAGIADETKIIEAAARAGVKWVIPSQYGAPQTPSMVDAVPLLKGKIILNQKIVSLGMKYVGVVTNCWIDYSIQHGVFGIDVAARKATLYMDSVSFNTTSSAQIGAGIASFLALPTDVIEKQFANGSLYLSSFSLTQPQVFEAMLRVTGTTEKDWEVERKTCQDRLDVGRKKLEAGDVSGTFDLLYSMTYLEGDYSSRLHNELLGLGQEDLDEVVEEAVKAASPGPWSVGLTLAY